MTPAAKRILAVVLTPLGVLSIGCSGSMPSTLDPPPLPERGVLVPGDTLVHALPAYDSDGALLEWALTDAPAAATITGGLLEWTPGPQDLGTHFFLLGAAPADAFRPTFWGFTVLVAPPGAPVPNHPPRAIDVADQVIEAGERVSLSLAASDPDRDPLSWRALLLPPGAVFEPRGAVFSWVPTIRAAGVHLAIFQVADDGTPPLTDHVVVRLTVVKPAADEAPVFTRLNTRGTTEACTAFATSFEAIDPDGEPVTFAAKGLPEGAALETRGGAAVLSWTPAQSDAGKYALQIYALDEGDPTLATEMVYVLVVTGPPELAVGPVPDLLVEVGHTVVLDVPRSKHACLTTSATGAPAGAAWLPGEARLVWPTGAADFGVYDVTYTVTDSSPRPASVSVTGRIAVEYVERFESFRGWDVTTAADPAFPGGVIWLPETRPGAADGHVVHSHSEVQAVVRSSATMLLDRTNVPLIAVAWKASAGMHGLAGCGGGAGFALGAVRGERSGAVAVLHGEPQWQSGTTYFEEKTGEVYVTLVHEDVSPACKLDVYWDEIRMIPIPAW